jgi:hypothetical protein
MADEPLPLRRRRVWLRLAVVLAFVAGAELTSRLDDWVRLTVPILRVPSPQWDLSVADGYILRGKPFGRHKNIQLNAAGFRGPPIGREPPPGCIRVMVVGASESVGEPGKDYPSHLQDSLRRHGCFEVQNAAMGGQALARMVQFWTDWASSWSADIVIVYATPPFYLGDEVPEFRTTRPPAPRWPGRLRPRLLTRIATVPSRLPEPFIIWKLRRNIEAKLRAHPPGWELRELPTDRVAIYEKHMDSLVVEIQAAGARPLMVTHAMRFPYPPTEEDERWLLEWQVGSRATAEVILEFERATNQALFRIARARGATVVDAAGLLNGRRELFSDFSHFTEAGAAKLAGLLADSVRAVARRTDVLVAGP